ncbi:uncharacterized protein A4U43_C01F23010 [Asparagus officinalis]|uniref:Uncharacterized protein n=1 Tax=Asparagus officinalis TaxID=4686 RepID=A0A5P1FS22_ASPOF|nr:uncharacterized protein A4U43_C01F23010 [Asparagus officinalis]
MESEGSFEDQGLGDFAHDVITGGEARETAINLLEEHGFIWWRLLLNILSVIEQEGGLIVPLLSIEVRVAVPSSPSILRPPVVLLNIFVPSPSIPRPPVVLLNVLSSPPPQRFIVASPSTFYRRLPLSSSTSSSGPVVASPSAPQLLVVPSSSSTFRRYPPSTSSSRHRLAPHLVPEPSLSSGIAAHPRRYEREAPDLSGAQEV